MGLSADDMMWGLNVCWLVGQSRIMGFVTFEVGYGIDDECWRFWMEGNV